MSLSSEVFNTPVDAALFLLLGTSVRPPANKNAESGSFPIEQLHQCDCILTLLRLSSEMV
jgi:hypothetical protein